LKRISILTLFLLIVFTSLTGASAQRQPCAPCPPGSICTLPECPPEPLPPVRGGVLTNPAWLKVDHHRIDVEIENQIAVTSVDLEFVNEGNGLAEGTFLFPLPAEASVDQLVMYINGQPIDAKILPADEARQIYNEIVRQYRDPALLEYVGTQAVQANVFPILPGESRRIEIRYSQPLEVDNGLIRYTYPFDVTSLLSSRRVDLASISVSVRSNDEISNIYSPSHDIAISRGDDNRSFRAGWERSNYAPNEDFSLYYGIASDEISVNLLSYRESATEDGFFMLMVQPPITLPEDRILPRDLIIVLDQSGSMSGEKWEQAQEAASYVLSNLNPRDRFNVILFSTGWRVYSNGFADVSKAQDAIDWIDRMLPEGGTDINGALTTAMSMVDAEREAAILFLTDGLPTEGVVEVDEIIDNVKDAAPRNARIFSFGVGNDVDTFLLDTLVREIGGASTYVRPYERIDEEVASLYNKIGAPVLTNIRLDFGDVMVDTVYPDQLPDLFAGTQLTIVGRYRAGAEDATITLSGAVGGERVVFVYDDLVFREQAGGEPFVARLWATRRIGDLLNSIRLHGENQELIDSIVNLSVRYGIITPYTSFLIEEDDILSQAGREEARSRFAQQARGLASTTSGAAAVEAADQFGSFAEAAAPAPMAMPTLSGDGGALPGDVAEFEANTQQNPVQTVGDRTFILREGVWTDTTFQPDSMETQKIVFLSDEYFALLDAQPELGPYFALGERVIVVVGDVAYEIVSE